MGRDQELSIVILYYEDLYLHSPEATSQGFTLALLLSSHLVHVTAHAVTKEDLERMGFCADLLTSIQVV